MLSPLYTFLDRFGEPLAQRVAQTFQILHDPLRDAGTTPEYDAALAALPRTCYPAQAEAAKALAKAFFVAGDRAVHLCGEMGTGKTTVALALLALAPQPLRVLVMCPPHLVSKWEREAQAVLPAVRAIPLGGRDALGHLIRLADAIRAHGRIVPSVPEVWILSRERAKLHYAWQPAVWRRRRAHRDPGNPCAPLQTWVEPACCGCGALLQDPDGLPLTDVQLRRTHTFCPACGEPAFGPDPQGPRRYAPAEFIKRHLRGVFDLFIPDEVHGSRGPPPARGTPMGPWRRPAAGRSRSPGPSWAGTQIISSTSSSGPTPLPWSPTASSTAVSRRGWRATASWRRSRASARTRTTATPAQYGARRTP